MKKIKISHSMLFILTMVFSLFIYSCDDDDSKSMIEEEEKNTIVDVAISDPTFSILVEALTKTNLVDVLDGETMYTVFAPTNEAFGLLLDDLGISSLDDIPTEDLKSVLLYHVLGGKMNSSALTTGYYSSMSEKEDGYYYSIYFNKDNLKLNGSATVVSVDVMADNGVIHVLDHVITPPSVVDHAIANPSLSSLTAAVVKAELASTLDDENANFTVFAPTDDAFATFLSEINMTLDDLTKETLTPILLYHVLDGFIPAQLVESGYVNTLSMAHDYYVSLKIDADNSGVMLNSMSNVVLTDVVATNGIIHVIDEVITPPTVVDIAIQNSNFSILVDAVLKAELAETLSGDGPFTVFAPTNTAFETLFSNLGISGISDLTKEELTPILLAHVVNGNVQSGVLTSGSVNTLNVNKSIEIDVSNGVTIDDAINVILADIQGGNGVVHVIDYVIVP